MSLFADASADSSLHAAILVGIMAAVTLLLRALPFLIFSGNRKTPEVILCLGRVLPPAIIGMLVIYCLKDVSLTSFPFGLPEAAAGLLVVLLQRWKRNSLLSILAGTIVYMVLMRCTA